MSHAAPGWRADNLANWNERVAIHLAAPSYDLSELRAGGGRLHPIEEPELPPLDGRRVLHLQCHFGRDSLTLARRGADVTGVDFSPPAIEAASALAAELGLAQKCRFVEADVYDAPLVLRGAEQFDLVFSTWGTISWLPDISRWAGVVAAMLRPGGMVYLADGHPAAWVLDDARPEPDGRPGWFAPYNDPAGLIVHDPNDYADSSARLRNSRQHSWNHGLGTIVTALIAHGLTLRWLHEHDVVPWRMFAMLVPAEGGLYRWPGQAWFPLSFSLLAVKSD